MVRFPLELVRNVDYLEPHNNSLERTGDAAVNARVN